MSAALASDSGSGASSGHRLAADATAWSRGPARGPGWPAAGRAPRRAGRRRAGRRPAARAAARPPGRCARRVEHRQRVDALAQVGAGRLAGLGGVRGDVDEVVGQLERHPELLAVGGHQLDDVVGAAAEHRAVARRRRDERSRSCRGARRGSSSTGSSPGGQGPVVADLPGAEPHERLRLDEDRLGAQPGDQLGRLAEEQVADEDRRRVVVLRVGARAPRGAPRPRP